ncbi:MAG: alpha/beta fold hydrolase [Candidatus Sulfotelmatobacter sp.]
MTPFESTQSSSGAIPKHASAVAEILTPIWQRLLQRSSIGMEENFFELGGTFASADMLFEEIARKFRRELPSATIFRAPTIAALASLLEQPVLPHFSPFVQLKAGSENPPILIAHGLGGHPNFFQLAKHIHTDHAIYGIQAKGIDGVEEPQDRIEDMARYYLDELNKFQVTGPHILIGYSFGGLVTLEMAQRLSKAGGNVALLALLDSYPDPHFLSKRQRLWLGARRIKWHISEMKRMRPRRAASYFVRGLEHRLGITVMPKRGHPFPEKSRLSLERTILRVKERAYVALRHYRPQFYKGKIKFVAAEVNPYFPDNPISVWGKLADEFEVETVPGGHLDFVTTGFEALAAVLTRYVEENCRLV